MPNNSATKTGDDPTSKNTVDGVLKWMDGNVFCLNPTKCKEVQIDFRKKLGASIPLESEARSSKLSNRLKS